MVLACCVGSQALAFDDITFAYMLTQDFVLTQVSLSDLAYGETVLLKTPSGYLSKLRFGYTTSESAGSTVYSVRIMEGVTYSPIGDVVARFEDVLLRPLQSFSVLTGTSSA